jgi:hypothetical protein
VGRLIGVLLLLFAIGPIATANGAMGLGLEQWDPRYWLAYVGAMVAFEAWFIGKWLALRWYKALTVSFVANFVTGFMCGLGGLCAPGLHSVFIGTNANPNPFWNSIALLAIFALPSALVEVIFWQAMFKRGRDLTKGEWKILGRSTVAHLISIPIGLGILLIPERPYLGMETWAVHARRFEMRQLAKDLEAFVATQGHFPLAKSIEALVQEVPAAEDDMWAKDRPVVLYTPDFRRFDTGEAKRHPFVLSTELGGKKIDIEGSDVEDWRWYLSPSFVAHRWNYGWGIRVEVHSGRFECVRYPEGLPTAVWPMEIRVPRSPNRVSAGPNRISSTSFLVTPWRYMCGSPVSGSRKYSSRTFFYSFAQNISPASSEITDAFSTWSAFLSPSMGDIKPSSCSMLSTKS